MEIHEKAFSIHHTEHVQKKLDVWRHRGILVDGRRMMIGNAPSVLSKRSKAQEGESCSIFKAVVDMQGVVNNVMPGLME